jgi:hypothetical protein
MKTEFIIVAITKLNGELLDKVAVEIPEGTGESTASAFCRHLAQATREALEALQLEVN